MNSATAAAGQRADLDDLMLAMDVVDTLRHQQSLVDHALSSDERDAALTERIRDIYRGQGIEVTDAAIAEGVKALREERFAYREPPGGFKTWLAKCYVRRAKAYKSLVALFAALGVWWGANFVFSTLPEQRELATAMEAHNGKLAALQGEEVSLKNRLQRVEKSAAREPQNVREFSELIPAIQRETSLAIDTASDIRANLKAHDLSSYQEVDDFSEEQATARIGIQAYEESLNKLNGEIATAEHNVRLLQAFEKMPIELQEMTSAAKNIGAEPAVTALANATFENAYAALKARDIEGAEREKTRLFDLVAEISASYKILIVSEPGEKTGVWRYPENNRQARNYYLVVEAVTDDGKRLERAIVSEEDGKTYRVKRWAMRVNEQTYNAVGEDKRDDGIVQNKMFGEKPRGYINPNYQMQTTGASIVSW